MGLLFLAFIAVPAVELVLLARIGTAIGWFSTVLLIITTGFVGAGLARAQGFEVLRKIQFETAAGRVPTDALLDGAMVLFAGALLLTPGILTDAVGFSLLFPLVRTALKRALARHLQANPRRGPTIVFFSGRAYRPGRPRTQTTPKHEIYEAKFDDE